MSSELNICTFTGRLGKDPEEKFMPDGKAISNFSLATSTSNKKFPTLWVNCVAFGGLAEVCNKYIKKGSHVAVSGELHQEKYEKNGVDHYSTKLVINNMKMIGKREDSDSDSAPAPRAAPAKQQAKPAQDDFSDDDIPF